MSEEIDAGRIVAQIVLDTKSLQDDVDSAKDKLNELSKTNSTVTVKANADYKALDYVKGSLEALGITGQKASDIINNSFINKQTVQNYASSLEDIAAKIDSCRTKIRELSASNIDSSAIASYKDALSSLETQYDKVLKKLDEYIAKKVEEANVYIERQQEIETLSGLRLPEVSAESGLKMQSYADTITYIREVLEKLQITTAEADKIIESCFSDVSSLKSYQNQLEIISQKLEQQKQLVAQLEVKKSNAQTAHNTLLEDKVTAQLEKEVIKLKELEARYDAVNAKQEAYVAKVVSNYQKQVVATEQATEKQEKLNQKLSEQQSRKDFSSSMFLVTSSLRTFNKVAPDAVNGMTSVIMQVNAIRRAMLSGASPALVWANVIVSAVGIVASFVVNEIEKTQQAQEEARQKAVQAAQEYKDNAEELRSLTDEYVSLKTKLDSVNMSHSEEIDVKNQLMNIQQQLVDKYGDEAKSIDFVTSSIDEQREAIEKLSLEQAKMHVAENYSAYQTAKEELAKSQRYTISSASYSTFQMNEELEKVKEFFESQDVTWQEYKKGTLKQRGYEAYIELDTEDAEAKLEELRTNFDAFVENNNISDGMKNAIKKSISDTMNSLDDEKIEGYQDTVTQYEAAQRIIDNIKTESEIVQEQTEAINQTIQNSTMIVEAYNSSLSELSSAYQTVAESGKLDTDTLNSLIEKYPALAEYIAETGDLTLKNGEIISSVMRMKNIEITQQLEKEKEALELQKKSLGYTGTAENIAQHEAIADRIEEINAQLKVYKENLSEIENISKQVADTWSDTSKELDVLASAYQTLADGKKLDIDTTLELIDKYPELASSMAKTGELGEEQADIFKALFEAKKNDYIITQQTALDNIRATEAETKVIIASIQTQMVMYGFKLEYLNQIAGKTAEIAKLEAEAEKYEAKIKALQNLNIDNYGGSGSGSDKNEALQKELKLLDHKKAIGQLTAQQELNWLNRINQTYSMNTDEKMDMEKRLYNVKKQLQEEAEQAAEDALNAEYERIENLKSLGKLNTQQELAQLEQIRKKYKLNAEQAMELEIKLYNLKKELKQEEIDSLDTLADAVTEALKNKYKEQQEAEEKLIDESIENWQKWEDETTSAIQAEIDALDKLSETQESENARQEYEQKRQATELQLAYEKDDYNRKQLEKELNRLDKEEAQRLLEEEIKARKEELQAQIESVQETSSAAQEKLNAEKDAISKNYEELTKEFNLRAEAEKVIMQSSQKEMVSLIKSYAPEYNMAGQTLGEQLYEGMKSKVDNIFSYIAQIESYVDSYQRQMAATANAATDDFWASRTAYEKELASMSVESSTAAKNVTVQQTVNFNKPVESSVETRRQLDQTSQALARQIASGT